MSARHQASRPPGRTRWHLGVTVPAIMTLIVALVLIGDLAISRRGHSPLKIDDAVRPRPDDQRDVATTSPASTRSSSAQLRAGGDRRVGAKPVTLPPAAPGHVDSAPAATAASVITALTTDLGTGGVSVAALN